MIVCPEIKQKQPQDRKTIFETLSLPVANQGRTNQAFSKPCLFLSDTRHFRHFRRFRWSEEPNPCFQWVEFKFVIFAVFVKMAPFWQGTKTRFTKNTVCATPSKHPVACRTRTGNRNRQNHVSQEPEGDPELQEPFPKSPRIEKHLKISIRD